MKKKSRSSIKIRRAIVSDAPLMHRWGMQARELWTDDRNTFYDVKILEKKIKHPGQEVLLVAEVNGKPVGMSLAFDLRSWAFMESLVVDPAYRRRRIGDRLFDATLEVFEKRGIRDIHLTVHVENKKARAMYERKGFRKAFPLYWMVKDLTL